MVFNPKLLTSKEESYYLLQVFNVNKNEARTDYIDIHGGRLTGPDKWQHPALTEGLGDLLRAANVLEKLKDAPDYEWFRNVSLSLKMYVSLIRSINNFYHAQLILDRHKDVICQDQIIMPKTGTRTGDPDYIRWNNILRDEYDNTLELISLLENGGLQYVAKAEDIKNEDTFLLSPEILKQVHNKAQIMRTHWKDVEKYLVSPLK